MLHPVLAKHVDGLSHSVFAEHIPVLLLSHELLSSILREQLMRCLATARPLQQGDRAEQNVPAEMLCEGWKALMLSDSRSLLEHMTDPVTLSY